MKTFDEARDLVFARFNTNAQLVEVRQRVDEHSAKFNEIIEQVRNDKTIAETLAFVLRDVRVGNVTPECALLSMLVNGVIIGIEMEKQEVTF